MSDEPVVSRSVGAVNLQFELTPTDMIRAHAWHFSSLWFIRLVYAVNLIAALNLGSVILRQGLRPGDIRGLLWLSFWFVGLPALIIWSGWRQYKTTKPGARSMAWSFTSEEIDVKTGLSNASLSWDALHRAVETRHALYLFTQKRLFHVLPNRALTNPALREQLRRLLKEHLGVKAKLRGTRAILLS